MRPTTFCRSNPDGVGVAPHCITSRTVLVSHTSTKNSLKFADMKSQKARTYKVYHSVCPLVEIGTLPTPLSLASVPGAGGRGTLASERGVGIGRVSISTRGHTPGTLACGWVRGWGSPNSYDWRKSLAVCQLLVKSKAFSKCRRFPALNKDEFLAWSLLFRSCNISSSTDRTGRDPMLKTLQWNPCQNLSNCYSVYLLCACYINNAEITGFNLFRLIYPTWYFFYLRRISILLSRAHM